MAHQDFLLLVLRDEAPRRDIQAAGLPAQKGWLDPKGQLEAWDEIAKVTFDTAPSTRSPRCASSTPTATRESRPRRRRQDLPRTRPPGTAGSLRDLSRFHRNSPGRRST